MKSTRDMTSDGFFYIFEDKNFDPSRLILIENTAASSPAGYHLDK